MKERLTLQEATESLLASINIMKETERVSLWDAAKRVLAEDIKATKDQPPFHRSPLDGYALRSADIQGASKEHPVTLKVIDEVVAGYMSHTLVTEGKAIRIMTGAPIPEGADCILGQEDTNYGENLVEVYASLRPYQNYCFQGEDYKAGKLLLPKGNVLGPVEVGVIAGTGKTDVLVYRKVRAAVFTTGDEIRLPGEELAEGKIYDNNLHTITTQLHMWDVDIVKRERVDDSPAIMAEKLKSVLEDVDLIITSGGVSVGKKDIMHESLNLIGAKKIFWRILIKPGMPTLCATCQGKPIICLSGNPYGAAVNVSLLGRPVIEKLGGRRDLRIERRKAVIQNSYPKKSGVTRYIRAYHEDGKVWIADGSNDSGILSNMCGCNCLIEVPAKTMSVENGSEVTIVML
ncbi:MAG: molybdopterin molybdotransferase MoeA [Dorea sp.]|nr:molybdopterin molybdotransferase MoeA [Dorea sp.]